MLSIYKKLFNIVFDKDVIPESLTIGNIKPIYKNKGNPKLPDKYRHISLSCLGNLFSSIISNRLNKFANDSNLILETQVGFRKKHSKVDTIFILNSLIDIVQSSKQKLFYYFVDFK
jgi:hypothetical protein